MTNLTNPEMCLVMRNGIEIWVDQKKGESLGASWGNDKTNIIQIAGCFINPVDLMGIFTPQALDEHHRMKRGEWRCKYGFWHSKAETECNCTPPPKPEPKVDPEAEREHQKRVEELQEKLRKETEEARARFQEHKRKIQEEND